MALRGRREPPSQSDGLGGPSYRFPQIVTALSIPLCRLRKKRLISLKIGPNRRIPYGLGSTNLSKLRR